METDDNGKQRFGKLVVEHRLKLGLSQQELAALMDMTDTTVRNWENGAHFPHIGKREKLCQVLHTTAQMLGLPPHNHP